MKQKSKYSILIGLREVAGYCDNLKKGFDKIGVEAHFLDLGGNAAYNPSKNPAWINLFNAVGNKLGVHFSHSFFLRFIWMVFFQTFFSVPAFIIALCRYNVFIFCANSSFFYYLELPVLKMFRKKIIYVFLGSDSRPLYISGGIISDVGKIKYYALLTWLQKRVVTIIEYFADACVNHPPQSYFHEKKVISLLCMGLPVNIAGSDARKIQQNETNSINILHAPSKSSVKGSSIFRSIIEKLKAKGYNINYTEVTGVSNAKVLQLIQESDFVLDELYSDSPMAVFATEAAFFGKPAVIGSYYVTKVLGDVPEKFIPPSCFVLPENIESAIEKMIIDKEYRTKLGEKAKAFIDENWLAEHVAENYLKILDGNIPSTWYYDPAALSYLHGAGLPQERAKQNIRLFIEKSGIKSLCLSDKPALEKAMREFAYAP